MGEQSNAYRILLRYDRKSRHRRIKKQRRYERLAATSQFLGSHALGQGGKSSYRSPGNLDRLRRGPASFRALERPEGPDSLRTPRVITGSVEGAQGHPATIPRARCTAGGSRPPDSWRRSRGTGACGGTIGNPCGNFSGTSSLRFRGTKGSIGHTFMVCIHTENQNQGDFYPFVLLEISVLHESPLGHLRYGLTDVPPQPNSPPDNVFNPDRPARDLNARSWTVKSSSASLNK